MIALLRRCYRPLLAFLALFAAVPAWAAFTDNGDGTVSDTITGLMWDKCSWGQTNNTDCSGGAATTHTWAQALSVAVTANGGNYKGHADWRLPNRTELESLVKIDASSPTIDTAAFPNTISGWYWTATTYAPDPALAWIVHFYYGNAGDNNKTVTYYVRLVRSGQSFASFDRFAVADTTPDVFTFTAVTGAALSTATASNVITVTGIDAAANISISGGEYAVSTDGGGTWSAWSNSSLATVSVNNQVKVRLTSSGSYSTAATATLTIGGVNGTFSVTTQAAPSDTTPDAFTFTAVTGAALSTVTASNAITVAGIAAAANISITGGEYAVSTDGGGTWSAWSNSSPATVSVNNQVKVRLTSSGSYSTAATATLTIGGVNGTFSVTTQAAPAPVYYDPPAPTLINAPAGVETMLTGTTPVTAAPGSILVIPAGANVAGVAITLPAPSGGSSSAPVTFKIGGLTLTLVATGADTVVTLKKVTINGVETLVLAVTSGSLALSAPAGQPLLTLNGSATLTAGDNGGAVSFSAGGDGGGSIAVTGGYVVLSANAFASTNGFATIKDGKLYAGEIAAFNPAGKITGVRLGSSAGSGSLGDPLKLATQAGLEVKAVTPVLQGKAARISATEDFTAALAASLGKQVTALGQSADGVLSLGFPGGKLQALPYGDITVDTSRPDGVTITASNRAEVAKSGVVARFAPAVGDIARFAAGLAKLDKDALVSLLEDGMVHVRFKGVTYPLQPAWTATADQDGQSGFSVDEPGMIVYRDGTGNRQVLYPVFADLLRLAAVFKALDADVSITGNGDGTATATFLGRTYTLVPDCRLSTAPSGQAGKDWWQGTDGKVFIRNGDGSVQGFSVR
ncbi:MAG: DUF1566 domain-containing protein [Sulfuricella sp.]|nr:DUF1566 domain-containing protein [Sulfuricella sp.]